MASVGQVESDERLLDGEIHLTASTSCVVKDDLEPSVLLPLTGVCHRRLKYRDYRHAAPCIIYAVLEIEPRASLPYSNKRVTSQAYRHI